MAERPALVLVGHGSAEHPDSGHPTRAHAETLRRRGRFAAVRVAFWKEPPFFRDALAGLDAAEVFVVPNLACRGYITGEVLPREMGLRGAVTVLGDGRRVHLCPPVGTHPRIAALIAAKVRGVGARAGLESSGTAVLLVGHGAARNPASAFRTRELAGGLTTLGVAGETAVAFLEQEPRVEDWPRILAAEAVVAVPFMISNGTHGARDIPERLGLDPGHPALAAAAADGVPAGPFAIGGRRLWLARAIGVEPEIAELIDDLARPAG